MSDREIKRKRNSEDRSFLHALSTPMAILKYSISKLEAESVIAGQARDSEAVLKYELMLSRVKDALAKMERIHGDFKMVVYDREIQDGRDPLDAGQNRRI